MTPTQKKILRTTIKAVAHFNPHAWGELKRQIFDYGYQQYYPAQGHFDYPAEMCLGLLPNEQKNDLIQAWREENPDGSSLDEKEILIRHKRLIVEEIVRRAGIAAYRTENW